jgi:RNA polymerase sigma-70 factor (ECF subfamily)
MRSLAQTSLARTAAADREQRFFELVEAHQDRAVRMAWRLIGGDHHGAEDVVQQAFLKAFRALDRFRDEATMSTWLYRIVVNEARSHRRWRALRDRWHVVWTDEATTSVAAATVHPDPPLQRRLVRALDRLTHGQREVFVLVYLEGFTLEQTAAQLGKAPGTIKSHLHRALETLRAELADLRPGAGHTIGDTP